MRPATSCAHENFDVFRLKSGETVLWCVCGALKDCGNSSGEWEPHRRAPRPAAAAEPKTKIVEVRPRWFVGVTEGDAYVFRADGALCFEGKARVEEIREIVQSANGAANLADTSASLFPNCEHSDVGTLSGVLWCRDCGAIKPQGVWHDTTPNRIGAP